jgi:hypothetical protein
MHSETLRKLNKILFWLWVFPGLPVSIYLRNSITWVVFLSVYAIMVSHFIEWRNEHKDSPETPDEDEELKDSPE